MLESVRQPPLLYCFMSSFLVYRSLPPPWSWVELQTSWEEGLAHLSPGESSPCLAEGGAQGTCAKYGCVGGGLGIEGVRWWHPGETEASPKSTRLLSRVLWEDMVASLGHATLKPLCKANWHPYSVLAGNLVLAFPGPSNPSP